MGCCFSRKSSTPCKNYVRVMHVNGCLEYFEPPVTVSQVSGDKPTDKHFLCTATQLLSTSTKNRALKPDTLLEPGPIYFLLPYSILQTDLSPVDLAIVVKKLGAKAKQTQRETTKPPARTSVSERLYVSSPMCSSPARSYASSPGRIPSPSRSPIRSFPFDFEMLANGGMQRSNGARSWRPNLDPIREKSFNRRSESDLQEQHSGLLVK